MSENNSELLSRVRSLGPLIEASVAADEGATCLSDEVLGALEQAGVFRLMAPSVLGGFESHPSQVIDVLSTLSGLDGSTGWYCQAATTGVAVAGAFLGDRAIEAIFHSGGRATCAGQAAPTGKAERVGDGYRISGNFSFGSGLPNASWVVGGYILHQDGAPVLRENGHPIMLIALAPKSKVEIRGNWNVLGLRGTGSYDFHVPEQIVHEDFAFDSGAPVQKRGGTLYSMGFIAIPALCHAAFGIGATRRALEEWIAHAQSKKRMMGGAMSEMETFQKEIATAHAQFRAAESYVRTSFDELFRAAKAGNIPDGLKLDARLSASNMITVGARIGQQAFTAAATSSLRNGHQIQRSFRDLQAGNAHFLTGEQSYIDAGRFLAGISGAGPGL